MNKWAKRTFITIGILFCGILIYSFSLAFYVAYQERQSFKRGAQNIEGRRIIAERDARMDAFYDVYQKGSKYEKEGKYDLAIEQYKKALEMNYDEWMAKCGLADAYEKSGQYELAIQEIDWIIAQNPRQQVKDEYITRKQKMEKLIEEKSLKGEIANETSL